MADGEAEAAVAKKSDLGVRAASAVVMLAVAGTALWLGGLLLDGFIAIIALVTLYELINLLIGAKFSRPGLVIGLLGGAAYVALAAWALIVMPTPLLVLTVVSVICVDVSAYFCGRRFGKRKIAPSISPSKTWAGLYGAMFFTGALGFGVALWIASLAAAFGSASNDLDWLFIIVGSLVFAFLAVVAQAGDFLESWLKRRAGVKDSSQLIPGHGGVFDRVDGLLPVAIFVGLMADFSGQF